MSLLAEPPQTDTVAQARPASQPESRDDTLWREIRQLEGGLAANTSAALDPEAALRPRRALLEKTRQYLAAYPGGRRRAEAVRIELTTLFEIGTLTGGAYTPLRTQVEEYLRHPPGEAALHEAAYWAIRCRRLSRSSATSQPVSSPISEFDPDLLAEYRSYVEQYPRSRHVPRMATWLFDAAERSRDTSRQRQLVVLLRREFPEHAVTKLLTAVLRRVDAVGKSFSLAFVLEDGARVDTARWEGEPVLIVVWAGFSEPARACARRIEEYRADHPEFRVVGVNLDTSPERMHAACQELGFEWPQFNDGMGWANRFAREWGVREVPWIFVVDRAGRLVGSCGEKNWREVAASALEN